MQDFAPKPCSCRHTIGLRAQTYKCPPFSNITTNDNGEYWRKPSLPISILLCNDVQWRFQSSITKVIVNYNWIANVIDYDWWLPHVCLQTTIKIPYSTRLTLHCCHKLSLTCGVITLPHHFQREKHNQQCLYCFYLVLVVS